MTQDRYSDLASNARTVWDGSASLSLRDPIDRIVLRLIRLSKKATLEVVIGQLVIDDLYGGSLETWRLRGTKEASFRKLATHPHLPMSPWSLYRSVAMYEMSLRLGVRDWKHVSPSHLRAVLPLSPEEQAPLLDAAEAGKWSVGRLIDEVSTRRMLPESIEIRGEHRTRSRRRPAIVDLADSRDADRPTLGDEVGSHPTPESVQSILEDLERVRQTCDIVEKRIASCLPGARSSPALSAADPTADEPASIRRFASGKRAL